MLNGSGKSHKPGTFQKGNQVALGNKGGQTQARRITRRIISKEWLAALTELDPKTQMTMARRLIRKVCEDGLQDSLIGLAVLKEGANRVEGTAVTPIITASMDEPVPMITREMTPAEATRIYQGMLRRTGTDIGGDIVDLDDEEDYRPRRPALPAPKEPVAVEPTISQRKEQGISEETMRRARQGKKQHY